MDSEPTLWCPSCGAEYRAGSSYCNDCRVSLVVDRPPDLDDEGGELVEIGTWPRLQAQILRRRLETAGMSVLVEWTGPAPDADGTVLVPVPQEEFARAVVNEIDVDDEVPDTSPEAYIIRIEEHLSAISGLLDEMRTRLGIDD